MLTSEVTEYARRSVLCWLATADETGQPNVSPKEVFAAFDAKHVVIANIASPTSVRNIAANQRVCVSFIDVFVQKGFKLLGHARSVRKADPHFELWAAPLVAKAGSRFPIHSVVVVEVEVIESIQAPSYRLYPTETTEQGQIQAAMLTYGVRPGTRDEL